jgi:hypothetical protein
MKKQVCKHDERGEIFYETDDYRLASCNACGEALVTSKSPDVQGEVCWTIPELLRRAYTHILSPSAMGMTISMSAPPDQGVRFIPVPVEYPHTICCD